MNEVIVTDKLTKHYKNVNAVEDVSLSVRKGEIYAFLGLNGAGKTTTIRMLLGMVNPTSGCSYLCGNKVNAGKYELWHDIGYLVEVPHSYPDLTVRQNLEMVRRLRNIKDSSATATIIKKLSLEEYTNRKTKTLSLGNAQRLGLAKALLHNPKILILDEPSNGLDPAGIVEVREMLQDLAENNGTTIFISSHILGEVAKLASRIGIIHNGKLMQEINASELETHCCKRLLVNGRNLDSMLSKLVSAGYSARKSQKDYIEILNDKAIQCPEDVNTLLVKEGLSPTLLKVQEEDLESYFLRIIGKNGGIK
jgi:ABC-2 type transport system ATP-binding protein